MEKPKLLLLDIETAPAVSYVWRLHDENISIEQIIKPSRVTCWSAKWVGQKGVMFAAEWTVGREPMLYAINELLGEADAVITYNGDHFDLPKLMGEFVKHDVGSPGPLTSIDLYKTVKKLGLQSGKLAFVAPYLGIGEKVKTEGFRLWRAVEEGDPKALAKMERYNKQDARMLEKLYTKLRPYIKNHPYLGVGRPSECPACNSSRVQRRGLRRTKSFLIERLHCQACGSWFDGVRSKIK